MDAEIFHSQAGILFLLQGFSKGLGRSPRLTVTTRSRAAPAKRKHEGKPEQGSNTQSRGCSLLTPPSHQRTGKRRKRERGL